MGYDRAITVRKAVVTGLLVFAAGGLAALIPWFREHYGALWFGPIAVAALVALQNWLKNRRR
jgi:hypothetical protein